MKINLKIEVSYVGRARCEVCQRQEEGVAFQLEARLPFGAVDQLNRQPNSSFYCWRHFEEALANPQFAIEIQRTVKAPDTLTLAPNVPVSA